MRNLDLRRSFQTDGQPGGGANLQKTPDFFIVGAPKCGTTAMTEYLSWHPDIFMARKEMHYFGRDLQWGSQIFRRQPQEYWKEFQAWNGQARAGEASVWYLYSSHAAAEIKAYSPRARIIIMVREPSDMLHALYHQFRLDGNEQLPTFAEALAAEPDRRAGRRCTRHTYFRQGLQYHAVAGFTRQIQRYFEVFGRERVQVVLYDDFAADTAAVYRRMLGFLGVEPTRMPEGFPVINGNHRVRSPFLRDLMSDPLVRGTALALRSWMPRRLFTTLQQLESQLMQLNFRPARRPPLDEELRQRLKEDFAPEVAQLGELLGRDLSHWSNRRPPVAKPMPVPSRAAQNPAAPKRLAVSAEKVPAGAAPGGLSTCSNS
jgi:hypothetical protein